jgi:hypothetical protein
MISLLRITTIFLILSLLPLSCKGKNPVEEAGDTLIDVYEGSKVESQYITLKNIQKAIMVYHAQNGRYPESLDEISSLMDTPIDIDMYEYNPENGVVRLKR